MVHLRGKMGHQVPVLLPDNEILTAIDLLVDNREKVGVACDNKYLFPAPTRASKNPLRGYVCLNNVVNRSVQQLKKPELIKSTKL